MDYLKIKGWYVKNTHGNAYQSGFPDIYAICRSYGTRWIEVKREKYSFTSEQLKTFHQFASHGVGIWILTAATDEEYAKLFRQANWYQFLSVAK